MDPYEADISKVPLTDLYKRDIHYGRYLPRSTDFHPDKAQINSPTYWESVLRLCTAETLLYEGEDVGRDIFAVGSLIIKSAHLKARAGVPLAIRDYYVTDINEVKSVNLVRDVLSEIGVKVPIIYFQGVIQGHAVLIQSRLPGVALNVAEPYLSQEKKLWFKKGLQRAMRHIHKSVRPLPSRPFYAEPDDDPTRHRNIKDLEYELLVSRRDSTNNDYGFVHNDIQGSNTIVDEHGVVAIIDWEMAGFFGWKAAADVHVQIRSPTLECFKNANMTAEKMEELMFWNDLYD